ncbi:winged helix-turn-helix transcriptional regulator [Pseudomaricurvus alcaniphilus]|uniref:winged helix-turn-helix domain-containing protein n=1 Tax=Pseudomaricurvus alcaniphilus TaxID=1166482 RepID=UPI001409E6A2|nr:winged helix-turn-helix domain-containing protein [Pseudomaricurvus alcaniphilus]NHN37081.1 winged helix-turn-helix transcriptional regulator [Pseudomaricurvus alcaniphilus]
MFVLKGLLRADSQENALVFLMLRGEGYARAIAGFYGMPVNPMQKQLARLEEDGVIVSELIGRVRNYRLNPRYPFIEPLTALLKAAVVAYPAELKARLLVQRTRPRQAGKPLVTARKRNETGE